MTKRMMKVEYDMRYLRDIGKEEADGDNFLRQIVPRECSKATTAKVEIVKVGKAKDRGSDDIRDVQIYVVEK